MADTETKTRIAHVGTVMVPVADQDRALEFYLGKLGFETRTDVPFGEGERWVEVARRVRRPRSRSFPRARASQPESRPGSASRARTSMPTTRTSGIATSTSTMR